MDVCATYAGLLMTVIVVMIPLFTGKAIDVDQKTGDLNDVILATCFTVLKHFITIGLYIGVICVFCGTCTPAGTWPGHKVPPVSPAVGCTMIMAGMFFLVYAAVHGACCS